MEKKKKKRRHFTLPYALFAMSNWKDEERKKKRGTQLYVMD